MQANGGHQPHHITRPSSYHLWPKLHHPDRTAEYDMILHRPLVCVYSPTVGWDESFSDFYMTSSKPVLINMSISFGCDSVALHSHNCFFNLFLIFYKIKTMSSVQTSPHTPLGVNMLLRLFDVSLSTQWNWTAPKKGTGKNILFSQRMCFETLEDECRVLLCFP